MANEISLETAVSEIKQACDHAGKKGHCPFFFIVGAGISSPPVPLAAEIIQHCKEKAAEFHRRPDVVDSENRPPIDLYSRYFRIAYPNPADRQEYLRELIEKKQISAANLRLAHLLLSKRIATIAVTPNFDDFLSRSLNLFGFSHIICDHPKTAERINILNRDIQIAHVHGTYWFYDCCNLRSEIEDRAASSQESVSTVAFLLDQILASHSPLVIGYSGWDGDVIMSALKRRVKTGLRYNLYWFCYKREDLNLLPRELREHRDVYFVLPPKETVGGEAGPAPKGESSLVPRTEKGPPEQAKEGKRLPADEVFEELIKAFKIPQPDLTRDPLGFMAKTFRESFFVEEKEEDIYYLNKVIEQVDKAKGLLENNTKEIELLFEKLRDLMRRSEYKQTIQEAARIELNRLDASQLYEILSVLWSAITKLFDDSEEELMGYDRLLEIGERLIKNRKFRKDASLKMATSILYKGITLGNLGKSQEAIAAYDEVVKRFGDSKEPDIQLEIARALVNKGYRLGELGRSQEEIAAYDEVVKRFGDSKDPRIQVRVAMALFNEAIALGNLGKSQEAMATYDEIVKRFGDSKEYDVQLHVAMSMVNKGHRLGEVGKSQEEMAAYDEVVKRFGDSKDPRIQVRVAMALFNKGYRLGDIGESQEAIETYEEVGRRFGDSKDPDIQAQAARATVNKGWMLGVLGKNREAVAAYEEVVSRFGNSDDRAIGEQLGKAFHGSGYISLMEAKENWSPKEEAKFKEALLRAMEKFDKSLQYNPDDPGTLADKAYASFLLGDSEAATKLLAKAVALGGEKVREEELKDADTHPLPGDENFKALLKSIEPQKN